MDVSKESARDRSNTARRWPPFVNSGPVTNQSRRKHLIAHLLHNGVVGQPEHNLWNGHQIRTRWPGGR
jgi:hypothetical protein